MNQKIDSDKKKRIAVIGDNEFTLGFELAGIQKTYNKENYEETIQELINRNDLGIIITKEEDLENIPKRIRNNAEQSVNPVVVSLSEEGESTRLKEKIKKAIGADITN